MGSMDPTYQCAYPCFKYLYSFPTHQSYRTGQVLRVRGSLVGIWRRRNSLPQVEDSEDGCFTLIPSTWIKGYNVNFPPFLFWTDVRGHFGQSSRRFGPSKRFVNSCDRTQPYISIKMSMYYKKPSDFSDNDAAVFNCRTYTIFHTRPVSLLKVIFSFYKYFSVKRVGCEM